MAVSLVYGFGTFFGCFWSATGHLDWLSKDFEWPIGYASGVVDTSDGAHIVPHEMSGRIQLYDRNWKFLWGRRCSGGGGVKVRESHTGRIEVFTSRGSYRIEYSRDGEIIHHGVAESDLIRAIPAGYSVVVPTRIWLWPFSNLLLAMPFGIIWMLGGWYFEHQRKLLQIGELSLVNPPK